jgi:hypothetical protein
MGIVVRDQFWARARDVGKPPLVDLGDSPMVHAARAHQKRVVSCFLDQRMLEDVMRARRNATLMNDFRPIQFAEPCLHFRCREIADRLQYSVIEFPPENGCQLRDSLCWAEAIKPGCERVA